MSADNGIYIARFPLTSDEKVGHEWRVVHAQAIDNCDYGEPEMQDAYRFAYFGKSKSYSTEEEALKCAHEIYKRMESEEGDFFILEYGISFLRFSRPLRSFSAEDLKRILD